MTPLWLKMVSSLTSEEEMEPTTEWITSIRTMSSKLVHVVYQIILLAIFFICSFPLNKGMLTCLALPSSLALWTLTNTHLKLGMKWEAHAHWPGTGISTPAITRTSWQTAGETNLMVVSNKHLWKKCGTANHILLQYSESLSPTSQMRTSRTYAPWNDLFHMFQPVIG